MTRTFVAAIIAAALFSVSAADAATAVPPAIAAAVADPARPDSDKERDALRKPAEVVTFAGVKPGMVVAEMDAALGYYTRILAKAVGPKGKVYALASTDQMSNPRGVDAFNALKATAAAYPNVTVLTVDYLTMKLPEKADLFWTTETYHDRHNGPTANIPALDKAVFDNLKPGGIFYVEDHSAAPGAGPEATSKFHRMDEDIAKSELKAAGFKIDGEGDALRNPADNRETRNSEGGHFATDRFMLRAKRP